MFAEIQLTPHIILQTYYLIISLDCAFLLGWVFLRAHKFNLPQRFALDLALILLITSFIGARLFHIFYEAPQLYLQQPWRIFSFSEGGYVYYGGFILALVVTISWLRFKKENILKWCDFYAPVISLGYAIGRMACFFAGCCYGKEANNIPWAIINPVLQDNHPRHPTQLYAAIGEFCICALLLIYENKIRILKTSELSPFKNRNDLQGSTLTSPRLGFIFFLWLSLHTLNRIIMEIFRDDPRGPEILNMSISSFISLVVLFLIYPTYLLVNAKKKVSFKN